jgi:hypothetical protein
MIRFLYDGFLDVIMLSKRTNFKNLPLDTFFGKNPKNKIFQRVEIFSPEERPRNTPDVPFLSPFGDADLNH